VIVTEHSAMREIGEVGWKVQGQPFWTQQQSWQTIPSIEQIAWALGEASAQAGRLRERAAEFALPYAADRVAADFWAPALEEIERRARADRASEKLEAPELSVVQGKAGADPTPPNRAARRRRARARG
jgi:hypothetical protein